MGKNSETSNEYIVPLLISGGSNINQENIFAILNDEVLFKKPGWDVHFYRKWNNNSLYWLFIHFREILPEEWREYFGEDLELTYYREKWEENDKRKKPNNFSLLAVNGPKSHHYQYSLEINRNKEQSIQMKNWTLFVMELDYHGYIQLIEKTVHLDYCLELTPKQALLLFTNNNVALFGNLQNVEYGYFARDLTDEEIQESFFVKGYLSWLRRKLDTGVIKPLEVLQYNGYNTLSYLLNHPIVQELVWEIFRKLQRFKTMAKNELLLYYTFYQKIRDKEYTKKLIQQGKQKDKIEQEEILSIEDCIEIDTIIKNLSSDQGESLEKIK